MDWDEKENMLLIKAILALETPYETRRFMRDLMTENEIKEFGKRLQTAELLLERVPYSVIEKKTGFSSTTVARVSKWLNNGMGGYKSIINKLHHHSIPRARGLG